MKSQKSDKENVHISSPGSLFQTVVPQSFLGRDIFIIFGENEMLKTVITIVTCFYLLDLDYPSGWLVSLSLLQRILFNDNKVHPECQADTVKGLNSLENNTVKEYPISKDSDLLFFNFNITYC